MSADFETATGDPTAKLRKAAHRLNARRGKGLYKSCSWIEGALFLDGNTAKICCIRNMGNDVVTSSFQIDDPYEAAGKIIENRRKLRIANQTENSPCSGCYLLKEGNWTAKKHFENVAISGFLHCNLACTYCTTYQFDPSDRGAPTIETLKAWHELGLLPACSRFEMGGGESTLHREFEEIADFAFSNGIFMTAFTNGVGVSKALLKGLKLGLGGVVISVDAGTAETYKKIKRKDVIHKVWESIRIYSEAAKTSNQVIVKYIFMDNNKSKSELDQFYKNAEAAGAKHFHASINVLQNLGNDGDIPTPIKKSIAYFLKKGRGINEAVFSETISPDVMSEIENMTTLRDEDILADERKSNWEGQLELAFSNSSVFLDRAKSIIADRDPFVIQFSSPVDDAEPLSYLTEAMDAVSAAQASIHEVRDSADRLIGVEVLF